MDNPSPTARRKVLGLGTIVAIVVALSAGMGVAAGVLSGMFGFRAGVFSGVIAPVICVVTWLLVSRRQAALAEQQAPAVATRQTVLLDAEARLRRVVQNLLPLAGAFLGAAGIAQLIRRDAGGGAWASLAVVVGGVLIAASTRYLIGWNVSYKGHTIRFENDPCFGERLFIDGALVDRGGLGVHMTLRGMIGAGDGAGERITATSRAGLTTFSCRIAVES
jgi:hypothetical protein